RVVLHRSVLVSPDQMYSAAAVIAIEQGCVRGVVGRAGIPSGQVWLDAAARDQSPLGKGGIESVAHETHFLVTGRLAAGTRAITNAIVRAAPGVEIVVTDEILAEPLLRRTVEILRRLWRSRKANRPAATCATACRRSTAGLTAAGVPPPATCLTTLVIGLTTSAGLRSICRCIVVGRFRIAPAGSRPRRQGSDNQHLEELVHHPRVLAGIMPSQRVNARPSQAHPCARLETPWQAPD